MMFALVIILILFTFYKNKNITSIINLQNVQANVKPAQRMLITVQYVNMVFRDHIQLLLVDVLQVIILLQVLIIVKYALKNVQTEIIPLVNIQQLMVPHILLVLLILAKYHFSHLKLQNLLLYRVIMSKMHQEIQYLQNIFNKNNKNQNQLMLQLLFKSPNNKLLKFQMLLFKNKHNQFKNKQP